MMKLITLNYRYEERRSANFQSVSVALEASVAIEESDDKIKVLKAIRQHIRSEVRRDVTNALNEIMGATPTTVS